MQDTDIEGETLGRGALAPQFRLTSGEVISLEALPPGTAPLEPGRRLRLTGQFLRVSRAMQGRGFRVTALAEL